MNKSEQFCSPLELDGESLNRNGKWLIGRIAEFIGSISKRPVTSGRQPIEIRQLLNKPLPEHGENLDTIFKNTFELLVNNSLFNGHPRFWGYVTSSPAPAGILADLLASAINANVGAFSLSPMATEIERQTIQWIAQLIGYPGNGGGLFVSGGNMANITAVVAARKLKAGCLPEQEGSARQPMIMYCSKATHTWVQKAADALGFGSRNIRWIDTDENDRIKVDALEHAIVSDIARNNLPFMTIGTAGTVGIGAVDNLLAIATISKKYDLWFHVDGAYGGPAAMLPELQDVFRGMSLADSVAIDPHKWLYSPLEAGCLLVRDFNTLISAFNYHPTYYNFTGSESDPVINYLDAGFQNSRGFKALKTWVTLSQIGRSGYIAQLRQDIALARLLYQEVEKHPELQAVSCYLSITTFRFVPKNLKRDDVGNEAYLNKLNEDLLNGVQAGGQFFVSQAVLREMFCLRACIVNFRTRESDIKAVVKYVVDLGTALHQENGASGSARR